VTRSSCRLPPSSLLLRTVQRTSLPLSILPARHSQFLNLKQIVLFVDDEPRGPRTTSPLQVGPPTRRELAPGHAAFIFDREALRAPARFAVQSNNRQTRVNSNYSMMSKDSVQTHNRRADPSIINAARHPM
jgi:hypothetical protein